MTENLVQITKNFTSRTAVLTYKVCPYKRYLMFELEQSGYVTERTSLDLLIGTCVHRGLQHLLEHCRLEHADGSFEEACIDEAVEKAYEVWREVLSHHQIWLHSGEEDRLDWIIAEQECSFEGLIRAFATRRLAPLLEECEILEVEHEEVFEDFSSIVTFLGKADGLLRRKADNKLIILSIKTASQYADVTTRDILHDMQGVSEWVIMQDRLTRVWNYWEQLNSRRDTIEEKAGETYTDEELSFLLSYQWLRNFDTIPEIFAVQYEYLLKGQRKQDPYGSGIYKQNSFLCHPYKLDAVQQIFMGSMGGTTSIDPAEYKWKTGKGKQPKGWEKADIWNDIGIKAWVKMLATGQVQPEEGHPFDEILVTPDLVVRDKKEMDEWLVSTRFQEENIVHGLQEIEKLKTLHNSTIESVPYLDSLNKNLVDDSYERAIQQLIWQYFPKNTLSCHNFYGKDCPYIIHCHEFQSLDELRDSGFLIRRESHHELERKSLERLMEE